MIGSTISHYRILEKLDEAVWASWTKPMTPSSTALLP